MTKNPASPFPERLPLRLCRFFKGSVINFPLAACIGTSCYYDDYTTRQSLTGSETPAHVLSHITIRNVSLRLTSMNTGVMHRDFSHTMRCHHCES